MSVRDDRLHAEHEAMKKFRSRAVAWEAVSGTPPAVYRFTYNLKSIIGFNNGTPQFHTGFIVELVYPVDFPRQKPDIHLVGQPRPFHPNIWADGRFCIEGDQHWIPGIGVPLDALCQMMGEIISFQTYNLRSPANNDSTLRNWLVTNSSSLPVDPTDVRLPDVEDTIRWGTDSGKPRIQFGE